MSAVEEAYDLLESLDNVVISWIPRERARTQLAAASGPLAGLPFVVKDNIDVAGIPTTAGCPAYAYTPSVSATVVRRLEAAGAVPIAKTNMDQFATGLVGTRTPFGVARNPWDPTRIPGGSSSGSAVAVAAEAVPFALGTDTAGSGRVPAALTGIVGAKPSRGWLSTAGVVPAVRSIDCVSVFARSVHLAWDVLVAAGGFDATDPYSREFGASVVPASPRIGRLEDIDVAPFLAAGRLLYEGPWVAERYASVGGFIADHRDECDPTVASLILGASRFSAADAASAAYELAALRRQTDAVWADFDVLVLPTVIGHPTVASVAADPIAVNAALGTYTSFTNLLDQCGVAVPTGTVDGLPVGVTVLAPAGHDAVAAHVAASIHGSPWRPPPGGVELAVVGAHLRGMPLHHQLLDNGATLIETTVTTADYRLYALAETIPPKPGLVRVGDGEGAAIDVEVYRLSDEGFGRFVAAVPAPMCIGTVRLADRSVPGFLCEPRAIEGATDITHLGGWRAYMAGP